MMNSVMSTMFCQDFDISVSIAFPKNSIYISSFLCTQPFILAEAIEISVPLGLDRPPR